MKCIMIMLISFIFLSLSTVKHVPSLITNSFLTVMSFCLFYDSLATKWFLIFAVEPGVFFNVPMNGDKSSSSNIY